MKPLKTSWYSLMLLFYLSGILTGRREFFLLLFIMGFVLLYSLVLNFWTIFSFSYVQKLDKNVCVKGSETSMRVAIYNDKPFPFAFISLAVAPVVYSQRVLLNFSLLPHSHINFTVPLPCPYRGIFGVGMTELEVNDSFGLVKTRFNMFRLPYYRQVELKVYPRLIELSILPAKRSDNKNFGNANQRYSEHGESYAGLRKYRPGDPLKRVHRAVSIRRHELYVKTYDAPFETSVLIALDTVIKCESEEDKLYLADLACECATAIANYSLRAGHRVTFNCTALEGAAQTFESIKGFHKLYDYLAGLQFQEQGDFMEILHKASISDMQAIYVISTRKGGSIYEALARLDTSNVKLISLMTHKSTRFFSDTVSDDGVDIPISMSGVWTIQVAVGDDVAAVLGEEVG